MSLPSPTTRRLLSRRLIQIASLGLAGLLAGLLTGCSSATAARFLQPHPDTNWQTASTYASATASLPPRNAARSAHARSRDLHAVPVASHHHRM